MLRSDHCGQLIDHRFHCPPGTQGDDSGLRFSQVALHDLGTCDRDLAQNLIRTVFVRRNDLAYGEAKLLAQDRGNFQAASDFVVNLHFHDALLYCDGDKPLSCRSRYLQLAR